MRMRLRVERQRVFNLFVLLLLVGLLLTSYQGRGPSPVPPAEAAPPAAQAAFPIPWTAVASTGTIDEASLNFFTFGTTDLAFAGGGGTQILARYNVTNTFDNSPFGPHIPGWRTLELGSTAPTGSFVVADLYRVDPCTGARVHLCRAFNSNGGGPKCDFCQLQSPVDIDFAKGLYYIELRMGRTPGSAGPRAHTLRIY